MVIESICRQVSISFRIIHWNILAYIYLLFTYSIVRSCYPCIPFSFCYPCIPFSFSVTNIYFLVEGGLQTLFSVPSALVDFRCSIYVLYIFACSKILMTKVLQCPPTSSNFTLNMKKGPFPEYCWNIYNSFYGFVKKQGGKGLNYYRCP